MRDLAIDYIMLWLAELPFSKVSKTDVSLKRWLTEQPDKNIIIYERKITNDIYARKILSAYHKYINTSKQEI